LFSSCLLIYGTLAVTKRDQKAHKEPLIIAFRSLRVSHFNNPLRMSVSISVARNSIIRQRSPLRCRCTVAAHAGGGLAEWNGGMGHFSIMSAADHLHE
jgi:hypothetical protein